jgi:hypothetical protein
MLFPVRSPQLKPLGPKRTLPFDPAATRLTPSHSYKNAGYTESLWLSSILEGKKTYVSFSTTFCSNKPALMEANSNKQHSETVSPPRSSRDRPDPCSQLALLAKQYKEGKPLVGYA